MLFTLSTLRAYLLDRHHIPPNRVRLDTDFRRDLHFSEADMRRLLRVMAGQTGLDFLPDTARHLTDVFELLVHVVFRLHEESYCPIAYFGLPAEILPGPLYERSYEPTLTAYAGNHPN